MVGGFTNDPGSELHYTGHITKRKGMVRYFYLNDDESHLMETWCVIDPFYEPFSETTGVLYFLDLRGLPVGLPIILTRTDQAPRMSSERKLPSETIRTDPLRQHF